MIPSVSARRDTESRGAVVSGALVDVGAAPTGRCGTSVRTRAFAARGPNTGRRIDDNDMPATGLRPASWDEIELVRLPAV